MEYRIKELEGSFIIQLKKHKTKGILWWKQNIYEWVRCNSRGGICNTHAVDEPAHKPFSSLDAAKQQIKKFNNPPMPIYHKCNNHD